MNEWLKRFREGLKTGPTSENLKSMPLLMGGFLLMALCLLLIGYLNRKNGWNIPPAPGVIPFVAAVVFDIERRVRIWNRLKGEKNSGTVISGAVMEFLFMVFFVGMVLSSK